jgi:hypothetical protein
MNGLRTAVIFDRFNSHMSNDDFAEVQRKLEAIASELKTAKRPEQRRELLRVMSRLVAEAERISRQPLEVSPKPEQPGLSKEKKSGNDSPRSLYRWPYTDAAPLHALSSPRCAPANKIVVDNADLKGQDFSIPGATNTIESC